MLTRAFGATKIFTTVSSKEHQEASLRIGADVAINYNEDDFVEVVKNILMVKCRFCLGYYCWRLHPAKL